MSFSIAEAIDNPPPVISNRFLRQESESCQRQRVSGRSAGSSTTSRDVLYGWCERASLQAFMNAVSCKSAEKQRMLEQQQKLHDQIREKAQQQLLQAQRQEKLNLLHQSQRPEKQLNERDSFGDGTNINPVNTGLSVGYTHQRVKKFVKAGTFVSNSGNKSQVKHEPNLPENTGILAEKGMLPSTSTKRKNIDFSAGNILDDILARTRETKSSKSLRNINATNTRKTSKLLSGGAGACEVKSSEKLVAKNALLVENKQPNVKSVSGSSPVETSMMGELIQKSGNTEQVDIPEKSSDVSPAQEGNTDMPVIEKNDGSSLVGVKSISVDQLFSGKTNAGNSMLVKADNVSKLSPVKKSKVNLTKKKNKSQQELQPGDIYIPARKYSTRSCAKKVDTSKPKKCTGETVLSEVGVSGEKAQTCDSMHNAINNFNIGANKAKDFSEEAVVLHLQENILEKDPACDSVNVTTHSSDISTNKDTGNGFIGEVVVLYHQGDISEKKAPTCGPAFASLDHSNVDTCKSTKSDLTGETVLNQGNIADMKAETLEPPNSLMNHSNAVKECQGFTSETESVGDGNLVIDFSSSEDKADHNDTLPGNMTCSSISGDENEVVVTSFDRIRALRLDNSNIQEGEDVSKPCFVDTKDASKEEIDGTTSQESQDIAKHFDKNAISLKKNCHGKEDTCPTIAFSKHPCLIPTCSSSNSGLIPVNLSGESHRNMENVRSGDIQVNSDLGKDSKIKVRNTGKPAQEVAGEVRNMQNLLQIRRKRTSKVQCSNGNTDKIRYSGRLTRSMTRSGESTSTQESSSEEICNESSKNIQSKSLSETTDEEPSLLSLVSGTVSDVTSAQEELPKNQTSKRSRSKAKKKRKRQKKERGMEQLKRQKKDEAKFNPVCSFFQQGKCAKGSTCLYKHEKINELCTYFVGRGCDKFSSGMCPYLHDEFPCMFFHKKQFCKFRDSCKFSHEPLNDETSLLLDNHFQAFQRRQHEALLPAEIVQPDREEVSVAGAKLVGSRENIETFPRLQPFCPVSDNERMSSLIPNVAGSTQSMPTSLPARASKVKRLCSLSTYKPQILSSILTNSNNASSESRSENIGPAETSSTNTTDSIVKQFIPGLFKER